MQRSMEQMYFTQMLHDEINSQCKSKFEHSPSKFNVPQYTRYMFVSTKVKVVNIAIHGIQWSISICFVYSYWGASRTFRKQPGEVCYCNGDNDAWHLPCSLTVIYDWSHALELLYYHDVVDWSLVRVITSHAMVMHSCAWTCISLQCVHLCLFFNTIEESGQRQ